MTDVHFNKHRTNGQSACRGAPVPAAARRALLLALVMLAAGCTSIYHRTRSELPPAPADEAELRIKDAQHAEDQARQAGKKLLGNLRQAKTQTTLSADFDRLEAAAYELERRTLAARDTVEQPAGNNDSNAEIERLRRWAQAWLAYVQTNRAADPAMQMSQLELLLNRNSSSGQRTE